MDETYHTLPIDDDKLLHLSEKKPVRTVGRRIKGFFLGVVCICSIMWLVRTLWLAYFLQGLKGKEHVEHAPHHPVKTDHFFADGEHNKDFDHEAVLGEYK